MYADGTCVSIASESLPFVMLRLLSKTPYNIFLTLCNEPFLCASLYHNIVFDLKIISNIAKAIFKLAGRIQKAFERGKRRLCERKILHSSRFVQMTV